MVMASPRKDLINMMPYWLQKEDVSGDWASTLEIFQASYDALLVILDRLKNAFDVDLTDLDTIVDAMLDGLGNPFDVSTLTSSQKRLLVRGLIDLYRKFGTDDAVASVVSIFTALEVTDIIGGVFDGWDLNHDVLGDGIHPIDFNTPTDFIVLYPSRLFQIYSYMLELDAEPTAAEEATIRLLQKIVKPAYMHYLGVHGYAPVPVFMHWELGESELDITSDVH